MPLKDLLKINVIGIYRRNDMSLIKIIGVGDELIFNVEGKTISIILSEKAGRQAVLKIDADKSIGITAVSKSKVWIGTPGLPRE